MFSRWLGGRWIAGSLCASALLLAGCGDFFTKDTGGGGGGSVGSYIYVGTQGGTLASYAVSTKGALSSLSGSPFQLSTAAINALAVTPGNAFLYAGVAGTGVFGLSINGSTGVTTLLNNNAVLVADVSPLAMTIDPSGKYLLVAGLANGTPAVGIYLINTDGTLSALTGSPVSITFPPGTDTTAAIVQSIVVAPNSSYVFVSLGQLGFAPLPFTTGGALSQNTVVFHPGKTSSGIFNQDLGLAVNASSTALFVGETNVGVRVFTIAANSKLTEISGSPFKAGTRPTALAFDGTGDFLYTANTSDNAISGFSVLASGTLTPLSGSPFSSVGTQPNGLTSDQSKKFMLVTNLGSPRVQLFSFDATTAGKLDPGATANDITLPSAIASTR
ncbi:MAG TPA: beta-propeller fold lactonase family protein [Acidobacteriaceae bacterium]